MFFLVVQLFYVGLPLGKPQKKFFLRLPLFCSFICLFFSEPEPVVVHVAVVVRGVDLHYDGLPRGLPHPIHHIKVVIYLSIYLSNYW